MRLSFVIIFALAVSGVAMPERVNAFNAISCSGGFCNKWDSNVQGTPAVVTWSFIDDPVGINPAYQSPNDPVLDFLSGTNTLTTLRTSLDTQFGAGAFDTAVQNAFQTWSQAANITFVQLPSNTPGNDTAFAGTTAIDIRIGAFAFSPACCSGAAGFGPPGNDLLFPDPLAGDIAINSLNNFTIATGAEGSLLPTGPGGLYLNDIEGLLLHEIGHTLGLAHSDIDFGVMCGYISPAFDGSSCHYELVNHQLEPDDIAGIQSIYGSPVPLPAAGWLLLSGFAGLGAMARTKKNVRH